MDSILPVLQMKALFPKESVCFAHVHLADTSDRVGISDRVRILATQSVCAFLVLK